MALRARDVVSAADPAASTAHDPSAWQRPARAATAAFTSLQGSARRRHSTDRRLTYAAREAVSVLETGSKLAASTGARSAAAADRDGRPPDSAANDAR